jgi:hypothetical protein
MKPLTPLHKQAFLRRSNELTEEMLIKLIDAAEISLDEFIEHGLDTSKVE